MEIKLTAKEVASAIYVYLAHKGHNADVTTLKTGIKGGIKSSLEYMTVKCESFEEEIDPVKLHNLVKKGEL